MRDAWVDDLRRLAHSLALYGATPLPAALAMPRSEAAAFFEGKAYGDWRQAREQEIKIQAGIAERLNGVIRACGAIVKTIAAVR